MESGGSYALAYGLVAIPALACGLWLLSMHLPGQPAPGDVAQTIKDGQ
jgi:hypothetical protein